MDVVESSEGGDSGARGAVEPSTPDTIPDVIHRMQENEELAIINEEGGNSLTPSSSNANAQERSLLDSAPTTIDTATSGFHVNDLVKEEIQNGAGETPTSLKGIIRNIDYGFIARRNAINTKNTSSSFLSHPSAKWRREANEAPPTGVDQSILDTFGFYCTCPEGFKGLKCSRMQPHINLLCLLRLLRFDFISITYFHTHMLRTVHKN